GRARPGHRVGAGGRAQRDGGGGHHTGGGRHVPGAPPARPYPVTPVPSFEDHFFTGNFQGQVSFAKGNRGKVGAMSENEPTRGSEEPNQHNDSAAQPPPAVEVGDSVPPATPSTVSSDTTPVPPAPPTPEVTPAPPPAASPTAAFPASSPWERPQAAVAQGSV